MVIKKSNSPHPAKEHRFDIRIFILLGISVLLYIQTLSFGFTHFDDDLIIEQNIAYLSDVHHVLDAFTTDQFIVKTSSFYRPLGTVSYIGDVLIGGKNYTAILHLTNMLLFCLIVITLYIFLKKLTLNHSSSFFASLIYAVHPVLVPSVAHLANRAELLLVLFSLLAFIFLIDYLKNLKIKFLLLHLLAFMFALFSKETAVVLPMLFLLYVLLFDSLKKRYVSLLYVLIFYAAIGFLWFYWRSIALNGTPNLNETFGISAFLINLRIIPESMIAFLFPVSLAPIPSFSDVKLMFGIIILLSIFIWVLKKSSIVRKKIIFATAWFLLLLVPSMLYKHPHFNYLYHRFSLPFIGLILLFIHLLPQNVFNGNKKINSILFSSLTMVLFILSFANVRMYSNPMTFYNAAIEKNKFCGMAYNNRGALLEKQGKIDEAINDYSKAIELNPNDSRAYYNRGVLLDSKGLINEALNDFSNAIKSKPDYAEAYLNRGNIYGKLKQYEQAINDYSTAIRLKPDFALAYNNRGVVWGTLGEYDKEIHDYNRAIAIEPNNAETYHNRGMALGNKGLYEQALRDFSKAIELSPYNAQNYVFRGTICRVLGKMQEACNDFNQAAQMGSIEGKENLSQFCQH